MISDDTLRNIPHVPEEHFPETLKSSDSFFFDKSHSKDTRRKRLHKTRKDPKTPRLVVRTPVLAKSIGDIEADTVMEPLVLLKHGRTGQEENVGHELGLLLPALE